MLMHSTWNQKKQPSSADRNFPFSSGRVNRRPSDVKRQQRVELSGQKVKSVTCPPKQGYVCGCQLFERVPSFGRCVSDSNWNWLFLLLAQCWPLPSESDLVPLILAAPPTQWETAPFNFEKKNSWNVVYYGTGATRLTVDRYLSQRLELHFLGGNVTIQMKG